VSHVVGDELVVLPGKDQNGHTLLAVLAKESAPLDRVVIRVCGATGPPSPVKVHGSAHHRGMHVRVRQCVRPAPYRVDAVTAEPYAFLRDVDDIDALDQAPHDPSQ